METLFTGAPFDGPDQIPSVQNIVARGRKDMTPTISALVPPKRTKRDSNCEIHPALELRVRDQ